MDDGTYAGKIPIYAGMFAFVKTLRERENELHSTLEDWILVGLRKGHMLPIMTPQKKCYTPTILSDSSWEGRVFR